MVPDPTRLLCFFIIIITIRSLDTTRVCGFSYGSLVPSNLPPPTWQTQAVEWIGF